MRPTRLTKTRCGFAARIIPIAPLPGANSDFPTQVPQFSDNSGVAAADANIDLQSSETEIEQNCRSVLGSQRVAIRTDLG